MIRHPDSINQYEHGHPVQMLLYPPRPCRSRIGITCTPTTVATSNGKTPRRVRLLSPVLTDACTHVKLCLKARSLARHIVSPRVMRNEASCPRTPPVLTDAMQRLHLRTYHHSHLDIDRIQPAATDEYPKMSNWSSSKGRNITISGAAGVSDPVSPHQPTPQSAAQKQQQQASTRLAAIDQQLGAIPGSAVESLSRSRPPPSSRAVAQRDWKHLPSFSQLPVMDGVPGCAWKLFGHEDQLGTVNLLTDGVVAQAAKEEIKSGTAISLSWPQHLPIQPFFNSAPLLHKLTPQPGGVSDEVTISSHSGSRWDGLRSISLSKNRVYYQGIPAWELEASFAQTPARAHRPAGEDPGAIANTLGIQHWARHGISGRGVLLDVWGYKLRNAARKSRNRGGKAYDPMTTHAITLQDLKETARAQGVKFRQGDILLIRTGFTNTYYNSTPAQREAWAARPPQEQAFAGVEQGSAVAAWFWDNHFAATASDSPTFESWPPKPSANTGKDGRPRRPDSLRELLVPMMGMPVGVQWDLEALTLHCVRTRRWTFFMTSAPTNVYGATSSPPNAFAYF